MLEKENSDGTYSYIESDTNSWPDDLVINYDKSGCIDTNGQIIEDSLYYDVETKIATVETGVTTKCYLYFDIDKTFAIYSETDNSLRFYNNNDYKTIEDKETYNDLAVTSVYKNFINETFVYDSETDSTNAPWFVKNYNITNVYVEDKIQVLSTAQWFNRLKNISYIDISNLNTKYVKSFRAMFSHTGYNVDNIEIIGLSILDTSNVENMYSMFYNAKNFNIGDLSNWNTSKVTNMNYMFASAGYSATTFDIGNLSNWDVSSVTSMKNTFYYAGFSSNTFYIGNISSWNVSNVTNMYRMFYNAGYNAAYTLDLSSWQVPLVTSYGEFELNVEDKIIAPTWVN